MTDKIVMSFRSKETARDFMARVKKAQPEGFAGVTSPCMWHGHTIALIVKGQFTDEQAEAIRALRRQR